jgi:hypothetical protein
MSHNKNVAQQKCFVIRQKVCPLTQIERLLFYKVCCATQTLCRRRKTCVSCKQAFNLPYKVEALLLCAGNKPVNLLSQTKSSRAVLSEGPPILFEQTLF